jgi:Putative capsular polysaccharide synthesis protein
MSRNDTDAKLTGAGITDPAFAKAIAEVAAFADQLRAGQQRQAPYLEGIRHHPSYVLVERLLADLTIVFSGPKVGGSTVATTLHRHPGIRPEASHIHFLSDAGLKYVENLIERFRWHTRIHIWQEHLTYARGLRAMLALNRAIRRGGMSALVRKPYLVAGVREPMAQYLSLIFETSWQYADKPDELTTETVRAWMTDDPWRRVCDDWLRDEMAGMFGLDVYARPFPTGCGWDVYENDEARLLVIRQENLDQLPEALGELFGLDPAGFVIHSLNEAANKNYAEHYRMLKRSFKLTEREQEAVYDTPHVRHFYTDGEIARFKKQWGTTPSNVSSLGAGHGSDKASN